MANKVAKHIFNPTPVKEPKYNDPIIDGHPLAWRFSGCDKQGPFGWDALEPVEKFKEVIAKLHEFESKTWDQLTVGGSHPIEKHRLEKPARDRLAAIKQDDVDGLMSFRISGVNRVWCIQTGHIMRILWWDPNHQVYIVEKDRADRKKRRRR